MRIPSHRCRALAALLLATVCAPTAAGIVYSAYRDDSWSVYYQTALDAPPRRIGLAQGDASAARLSPDGRRVAFETSGAAIRVCSLDSECAPVQAPGGAPGRPSWHPLTGELVFATYRVDANGEDSDIFTTVGGLSRVEPLVRQTGNQDYPGISPDGRSLVYASGQTVGLRGGSVQVIQQLWLMELESGTARQLTHGSWQDVHPDWSPAGDAIAFASNRSGRFEIWVVGADGGAARQLTSGAGVKTWPSWSPDGESLIFTMVRDGRQGLWLIRKDGTHPRAFEPFGAGAAVPLRDGDWQ